MSDKFVPFNFQGELTPRAFKAFLKYATEQGASDILIQSGDYAWVEIHGRQVQASVGTIKHGQLPLLLDALWGADVQAVVRSGRGADRSFQLSGEDDGLDRGQHYRFRVNFIQARVARLELAFAITMRTIPQALPDIHSMGVEADLLAELYPAKGLVLVCGPTGSGKTTFQAGVYGHAGATMPDRKVITYEDPIEFVLGGSHWTGPQPAQSEIGRDIASFADGLRNGVRRKPSIIGIGEIRDLETADAAIEAGLTGHLCYATMHTDSVPETINRAIQLYPPALQAAVASRIVGSVRVILVQRLLKTTDGRRTAVREYVIFNRELRNELQSVPYTEWPPMLRRKLEAAEASLEDKAWRLFQGGRVSEDEFIELAGDSEFRARSKAARLHEPPGAATTTEVTL
jgi:defect-in-organelle-trafficking protein DotB